MKNKTALFIIIFVIVLAISFYFIPVGKLLSKLPILNSFYNNTSLEIITQKGKAKIWIDGESYGETPTTVENLPEGTYTIELEKIVNETSFYTKHSFKIDLSRNTTARIDLEIGPDNLLHGSILYYTPTRTSSKKGFLNIISNIDSGKVFLDKEFLKNVPITNLSLKESQYEVKVTSDGYEDVIIPVLIRDNYSLNLKTYHFPIPVSFEKIENTDE